MSSTAESPPAYINRGMTVLFAVAGGAAVANLYWAQPLLDQIARSFDVSSGVAGLLITVGQIGYAVGVFLIVPLGDILNRRRLIPRTMLAAAVALAGAAVAPDFASLLLALAAVGVTTVCGPMLTPLAGDLADPAQRGRIVGTVASGLMIGVLASRTISGLLANAFGWRAIYGLAAVVALLLALLLNNSLPRLEPRTTLGYPALLGSIFTAIRRGPGVPVLLIIVGIMFSVFSLFWTALTFLLSAPPFSFSVSTIGLFGLAGLAGAFAAQRAGRIYDRGWSVPATGLALTLALVSLVLAGVGGTSVILLLVAIVLLDIAARTVAILSQNQLFAVDEMARSRLNTAYVVSNFIGGAIGSALAAVLWQTGRWTAVSIGGGALMALALVAWLIGTRALHFVYPGRRGGQPR